MQRITITDGREVTLDMGPVSPEQGAMLAVAAVDLLLRSGRIRDDVALNGPQLLQFMSELGDELAERRADKLLRALDAAHLCIGGNDAELGVAGIDRDTALRQALELRDLVDPPEQRETRREDWDWAHEMDDLIVKDAAKAGQG